MTSDLDELLRESMAARTRNVRTPAEPDWRASSRRRRAWLVMAPIAAACAVMVALVLTLILTPSGRTTQSAPEPHLTASDPTAPAPAPEFALLLHASVAEVVRLPSGHVVGTLRPPAGYSGFDFPAAATTDGRAFFVEVGGRYVVRTQLDDQGRPGPWQKVTPTPGGRQVGVLAVSPDNARLAITSDELKPITPGNASKAPSADSPGAITINGLAARWSRTYRTPAPVTSLAWDPEGKLLHWTTVKGSGTLDPSAAPTTLKATQGPADGQILPNGDLLDQIFSGDKVQLVRRSHGHPTVVLDTWTDHHGATTDPALDAMGQHVLYVRDGVWTEADLLQRTHTPTRLTSTKGGDATTLTW